MSRPLLPVVLSWIAMGCSPVDSPGGVTPSGGAIPSVLWVAPALSTVGPPAVDDTTVYVVTAERRFVALSRFTGSVRWEVALANVGTNWGIDVVDSTVLLSVDRLVALSGRNGSERWRGTNAERVGTLPSSIGPIGVYPTSYVGDGSVSAFDALSGAVRWRSSVVPPDTVVAASDQVRALSPSVSSNALLYSFALWKGSLQPKGGLARLDALTGELVWSRMLPFVDVRASSFPARASSNSSVVAVTTLEGFVYLLSIADGSIRWTGERSEVPDALPQMSDIRPVLVLGEFVAVGSGRGFISVHRLSDGARVLSSDTQLGAVQSLHAVGNNRVLSTHLGGGLSLVDLVSNRVSWRFFPRGDVQRVHSVQVSGDTVFASSTAGGLSVFVLP